MAKESDVAELADGISELDLALINALQLRPRAEWAHVAAALGVNPATAARRWQSLRERGLAWVAVTLGPHPAGDLEGAFVLVSCSPEAAAQVARQLVTDPAVATVATTMGHSRFLLDVLLPDFDSLRGYLNDRLPAVPGVSDITSLLITGLYTEGGHWRVRALDPHQRHRLDSGDDGSGRARRSGIDSLDRALLAELAKDGRQSWARLGAGCGVSAQTARRRIEGLMASGAITLRCEMATPQAGPALAVTYLATLPADQLDAVGAYLAGLANCRLAASVAGPHNLLLTMWLPDPAEITRFEASLTRRLPELVVADRIVHLATVKRVGHLLDDRYRTTAVIPLAAW